MRPTPTDQTTLELRRGTFETLTEALDYAAKAPTGFNFYSSRGELLGALPYTELRERAVQLARGLVRAGMAPGSRLLLLADTDADFAVVFMACQYASVLPVPVALPTSFGEKESYAQTVRRQLADSGARAAVAPAELIDSLKAAAEGLDLALVGTPQDFYDLPAAGADLRPFAKHELCYIQYSSGSTRFPRGIEITQEALTSNCRDIAESGLQVAQDDRCVSWLPLYHDMGLVGFMLTPLCTQLSVDYLTTRDFARRPITWLKLLSENAGTLSYSPSFGYDICVRRQRNGATDGLDLSSWRVAGIGGDMIQPKILELFCERFEPHGFRREALVPSYGMAETTLAITFASLGEGLTVDPVDRRALAEAEKAQPAPNGDGRDFVVCGAPMPGYDVEVRDEKGKVLPERRVGRVHVRGPSLMRGYFRRPDETSDVLLDDGWLNTGDIGYLTGGRLVITGRSKDLIILNGRNIWPQDLEWAVEELPSLRRGDAAAFSVDEGMGEQVVLLVQCRSSEAEVRETLRAEVKNILKHAAIPDARVVLVPPRSLPQTTSGKLSRSRARRDYLAGRYDEAAAGGSESAKDGRQRISADA